MGQKVHPLSFRLGVIEDWRSRWYAGKKEFGKFLVEDQKIRKFIKKNFHFAGIPKIEIERTRDDVIVTLHAARPGVIIGRKGAEVDRLKGEIEALTERKVAINIREVLKPELESQLVAESVAEQLAKRASFRRVMKRAMETSMKMGALGVKIQCSGRLAGSEMARCEGYHQGKIPLHTIRADICYGFAEAGTPYGHIGVKVWIYRGLKLAKNKNNEKKDAKEAGHAVDAQAGQVQENPAGKA